MSKNNDFNWATQHTFDCPLQELIALGRQEDKEGNVLGYIKIKKSQTLKIRVHHKQREDGPGSYCGFKNFWCLRSIEKRDPEVHWGVRKANCSSGTSRRANAMLREGRTNLLGFTEQKFLDYI